MVKWYGHIERITDDMMPKQVIIYTA
jgi:hypothetical protein